ncbi:glucosamine 6-phosphate N-acetyltransferase, partial [Tanacetum coccineum]
TGARGAIIMMDVTRITTLSNVPRMFRELRKVCGNIPVILCGNKVDMDNKQVHVRHLVRLLTRYPTLEYTEISALSNYNFGEPFLSFITYYDAGEDSDVRFDPLPDLLPPEVEFDIEAQTHVNSLGSQSSTTKYSKKSFEGTGNQQAMIESLCVIEESCGKAGHIEDVVVDSSARGMQLGKKVIGFLADHARSMGCYKVILDCSVGNKAFYEKCGFKEKEIQMVKYFV